MGDRLAGLGSDKLVTVHIAVALGSSGENPGTDTAGMEPVGSLGIR